MHLFIDRLIDWLIGFLFSLSLVMVVVGLDQSTWANDENQCDGMNQSPIDIQTGDAFFNHSLALQFINYDEQSISYKVTNNGHSSAYYNSLGIFNFKY